MPDFTIPSVLLLTLGVLICLGQALHSGDYRIAAATGALGTMLNAIFFYHRLILEARRERSRNKRTSPLTADD